MNKAQANAMRAAMGLMELKVDRMDAQTELARKRRQAANRAARAAECRALKDKRAKR